MSDKRIGFGRELFKRFSDDDASGMAAELAYRLLFAIFPLGLFLAALGALVAAWIGIANPTDQIIATLGDNLPAPLVATIRPELQRVIAAQHPGIASLGALLALAAATSGTMTVIKAMNRAYGVKETRPIIRRFGLGIGLTVAGALALLVAFLAIVASSLLTQQLLVRLGIDAATWSTISLVRWPLVLIVVTLGVSILYRVGPNMRPSWRAALLGAVVFALGWVAATFGLAIYVTNVARYGATYGTLAGVIVLLFWLYLSGLILIVGAEVVAVVTRRLEPARLADRRTATSQDGDPGPALRPGDEAREGPSPAPGS